MSLRQAGQIIITDPNLKWVINTEQFDSYQKDESINSSEFFVSDKKIHKFYILFYPKGRKESTDDHMSLYLFNDNNYNVTLDYSFSLLNNDNFQHKKAQSLNHTIPPKAVRGCYNYVSKSFVFDPVNKLIKDGKLTIVFSIIGQMVITVNKENQNCLSKINEQFFTNKKYSDITIKTNENELKLHKVILATRSTVFEAIFNTDMMEKEKNIVEINDIDPDILYQFFKYLYTNKVDNFEEIAKDLFIIADKYLVYDLKNECEKIMCSNINLVNALDYLKIADMYSVKTLESEVIEFITNNIIEFGDKPEFKSLTQENLLKIINQHICILKSHNKK